VNYWHHIHGDLQDDKSKETLKETNIWNVIAVELDASIVQIAAKNFGLSIDHPALSIRIGDGLHLHCLEDDGIGTDTNGIGENELDSKNIIESLISENNHSLAFEKGSMSYIVLDVDSKDSGAGMSCPPASFVEISYLQTLYNLLNPENGILAINVAARDIHLFHKTCQAVQRVFPFLLLSKRYRNQDSTAIPTEEEEANEIDKETDDLNVVLFATRNIENSQKLVSSLSDMTDHITRWIVSTYINEDDKIGERSMLRSYLVECLSDFVLYDSIVKETSPNNSMFHDRSTKNGSNDKRRHNRRGNKKKK
jgi:hypothetical protein